MEEFVNEIITSLQDNPEWAYALGGAATSIGLYKGRGAVSTAKDKVLDEVAKAVYDPISYSTNDLDEIEGPIRGYLAERRKKWDEETLGAADYHVSDD